MSHHDAAPIRKPRIDDRPLWDVVLGVYGYPAVLFAHRLELFPLLAEKPLATRAQGRSARRQEETHRMGSPW